jgi:integrase
MRGDGRIFEKPGSQYWHYEFWLDGEPVRGSTGKTDRDAAERVLRGKIEDAKRGDAVPHEERLRLGEPPGNGAARSSTRSACRSDVTLYGLLDADYRRNRYRSLDTMQSSWKHLTGYFGVKAKAVRIGRHIEQYIEDRRKENAAEASIRIELALLDRACKLAVEKKLLSPRSRPLIKKPPVDETRVREGFFRREAVERLCQHLPDVVADVVLFLFFCPWRVGAARRLEWRDYSEADRALTLRPEVNKTKHKEQIPVDSEHTPELMAVIEIQQARRRPDCPFIFHGRRCGTPRFDKKGNRQPCLGDFQKVWDRACEAIGMAGRIPHDLRRSGVKHYIDAGVDPHTVMKWSGHRTPSMLARYHIIDLDDLRRAGKKASEYRGPRDNVVRPDFGGTRTEPAQRDGKSRPASQGGSVRG